jgi:hypothetical protein
VSDTLEQLRYTWATRGVQGTNRLQIAGMSLGLRSGPLARQLPTLKRLCQYPQARHEGSRPISYGWLDSGGYRIVFCRRGLAPTAGKVGNFAAHLVIGDPRSLPEAAIAVRFESAFWWDGGRLADPAFSPDPASFELPPISLADIAPAAEDGRDEPAGTSALCYALLNLGERDHLSVDPETCELGRSLRAIARSLPEALDGITFSTYENKPLIPFRVLGIATAPSMYRTLPLRGVQLTGVDGLTVGRLRGDDHASRTLRAASRQATDDPIVRRQGLWATASSLVELATSEVATENALSQALSAPAAARYLARDRDGREKIVAALAAGSQQVTLALRAGGEGIESDQLSEIIRALSARYTESASLAGISLIVSVLSEFDASGGLQFARQALTRVFADPALCAALTRDDVLLLVDLGAQSGPPTRGAGYQALAGRAVEVMAQVARNRIVPDSHVLDVFRLWLAWPHRSGDVLVEVLRNRPHLLAGASFSVDTQAHLVGLLSGIDSRSLELVLAACLPVLAAPESEASAVEMLTRMSFVAASSVLSDPYTRDVDGRSRAFSALRDDFAATWIETYLRQAGVREQNGPRARGFDAPDDNLSRALTLLRASRSGDYPLAAELLLALTSSRLHPLSVLKRAASIRNERLRRGIGTLALDRAICRAASRSDLTRVWNELQLQNPGVRPALYLHQMLNAAWRNRGEPSTALLLFWVGSEVADRIAGVEIRKGRLCNQTVQALCSDIARFSSVERLDRYVEALEPYPHARSWWGSLINECRAQNRRSRWLVRRPG